VRKGFGGMGDGNGKGQKKSGSHFFQHGPGAIENPESCLLKENLSCKYLPPVCIKGVNSADFFLLIRLRFSKG
jgi:hypothetical protein